MGLNIFFKLFATALLLSIIGVAILFGTTVLPSELAAITDIYLAGYAASFFMFLTYTTMSILLRIFQFCNVPLNTIRNMKKIGFKFSYLNGFHDKYGIEGDPSENSLPLFFIAPCLLSWLGAIFLLFATFIVVKDSFVSNEYKINKQIKNFFATSDMRPQSAFLLYLLSETSYLKNEINSLLNDLKVSEEKAILSDFIISTTIKFDAIRNSYDINYDISERHSEKYLYIYEFMKSCLDEFHEQLKEKKAIGKMAS